LFAVEAADVVPGGRRVVNRKGDSPVVDFGGNMHYFLATDIAQKHYFPIVVDVGASVDDNHAPEAHSGEEFAYVIEGVIEFRCEGYAPARLEAGDSVYFDASLKHRYVCAQGAVAKMLCVYSNAPGLRGFHSSGVSEGHSRAMQIFTKSAGKTRAAAAPEKSAAARAKRRRS
ncbi:MAG: cupin domain-containing protein, partial [Gammaproteobacteria bacterium]